MWNGDGKWEEDGEALKYQISSKGKTKLKAPEILVINRLSAQITLQQQC